MWLTGRALAEHGPRSWVQSLELKKEEEKVRPTDIHTLVCPEDQIGANLGGDLVLVLAECPSSGAAGLLVFGFL